MKKPFLITLAVVLMLLLVTGFFLGSILGHAITAAVNRKGPEFTGTRVTLGSAHLSPFTGVGTLNDLVLGNPDGYQAPNAFSVEKVHVTVRPLSLVGETVDLEEIEIRQPQFDYETTLFNSNFKTILEHVKKAAGADGDAAPAPGKSGEVKPRKVIIRHFLLEDARVTVSLAGRTLVVPVARLELQDIGVAKGGVTPAEATQEILKQVLGAVLESARKAFAENPATLGERAKDTGRKIGDAAKELWEKATGP